jgi:hypothetical protein
MNMSHVYLTAGAIRHGGPENAIEQPCCGGGLAAAHGTCGSVPAPASKLDHHEEAAIRT